MRFINFFILVFAVLFVSNLKAEERTNWYDGFYLGAGATFTSSIKVKDNEYNETYYFMPSNVLINIFTGYEIHKYLDVELGFELTILEKNITEITENSFFKEVDSSDLSI